EAKHQQQQDRPDRRADQVSEDAVAGGEMEVTEQPPADEGADHADDNVADQAKPVAFHDDTAEPAGDRADQQEDEYGFGMHVRLLGVTPCGGRRHRPERAMATVGWGLEALAVERAADRRGQIVDPRLKLGLVPWRKPAIVVPHAGFLASDGAQFAKVLRRLVLAQRSVGAGRADALLEPPLAAV